MVDLASHLAEEFKPLGYTVCERKLPYFVAKIGSWFSHRMRPIVTGWGVTRNVDNSKAKLLLGMDYKNTKDSMIEMGYSLIDQGFLEDKRK